MLSSLLTIQSRGCTYIASIVNPMNIAPILPLSDSVIVVVVVCEALQAQKRDEERRGISWGDIRWVGKKVARARCLFRCL